MTQKERLVKLLGENVPLSGFDSWEDFLSWRADHLLSNGVRVIGKCATCQNNIDLICFCRNSVIQNEEEEFCSKYQARGHCR